VSAAGAAAGPVDSSLPPLGWLGIIRLGLVQTALGAIVVMATSTMNRVMVVELMLPAVLPGALVALHYGLQTLRPRLGHGSDQGGRRTPWIIGGMAALALGDILAVLGVATIKDLFPLGLTLAVAGFTLIGIGAGSAGTSLLVLIAKRVAPQRRPAAAAIVWSMMIAGFAVTAITVGHVIDPFSTTRLVEVVSAVAGGAFLVSLLAVWGVEGRKPKTAPTAAAGEAGEGEKATFVEALRQVWAEPDAQRFAIFIFISMLAYGAQELVLDPFAGAVFGLTPGQSTKLSGIQHSGVLLGMILVGVIGTFLGGGKASVMRAWTVGGCLASAVALAGLAGAGFVGPSWPLKESVFVLGIANGIYAVSAIGSMMALVGQGRASREGVRMGLWGAAQAIAMGVGGLVGSFSSDMARLLFGSPVSAYAAVFVGESLLFILSALLALRLSTATRPAAVAEAGTAEAATVE